MALGLFTSPGGTASGHALRCWLVWYSNSDPCTWLVPLLICTLVAAPPARPCSASKLLVTTLTVSMDSSAGTYAVTCGSQILVELIPSMRVLFDERLEPLTLKTSERDGLDGTECASAGGVKPGSVLNSC